MQHILEAIVGGAPAEEIGALPIPESYRAAFVQGFRRRGIYPEAVRSLSTESVCWERPEVDVPVEEILERMKLTWDLRANRRRAYDSSRSNAALFNMWITGRLKGANAMSDDHARALGFYRSANRAFQVGGVTGELSPVEVHSVRPARRHGPRCG